MIFILFSIRRYYLEKVLLPAVYFNDFFLLLVDSWSGQKDPWPYRDVFGGRERGAPECRVEIIPDKCTNLCQPLDTTFHRQLKYLAKKIVSHFELFEERVTHPDDLLHKRNGILKLQSLLRHQLSAPIFVPMIRYAWKSSGYIDDAGPFQTVKEVCFDFLRTDPPNCMKCNQNQRFIKCSRCRQILCFDCFFFDYHIASCTAN